ncbi:MAG: hypothetical protein LBK64_03355, partial [Spirochaetaceae bacterium]|nr:hypothetical protein [Spirochaetaceae bacterium]
MKSKTETGSVLNLVFRKKDKRINAGYMSIKEYFLLFFAVAAVLGFHMVIYVEFADRGMMESNV